MTNQDFTLSIDDITTLATEILALEEKNQKRWNKTPRMARGEDLQKIILNCFPDLDSDDIAWTALWVDIYISLFYTSEEGESVALLSHEEAVMALMEKTEEDLDYFASELEWIGNFGCLLTEGSASDIGGWFFDPMWDRLYEIEAIAPFDDLYDDGVSPEELATLATSEKPIDRAKAANISATPADLLAQLSLDSSSGVRFIVALNPNTPSADLARLSTDQVEEVRIATIGNPSTPADVLDTAVKSVDETIRRKAASAPHISLADLEFLARDKSEYVRAEVAKNESVSAEILATLAGDKSQDVREAVAENSNTSEQVLKTLTKDKEYLVRLTIAYRDDLTDELREILAKDKDSSVRDAVSGD
jgi:hypothetical protein